jgi:hypothetical protein
VERGCVVLDQPQRPGKCRDAKHVPTLRLVFETAALRVA